MLEAKSIEKEEIRIQGYIQKIFCWVNDGMAPLKQDEGISAK